MRRVLFRLLCIVLLLAGQQAAVTHALAHAQDRLARTTQASTEDGHEHGPGGRFSLCDFDYAYSQVLGAVHPSSVSPLIVCGSYSVVPARNAGRCSLPEVPFLIRGPPVLLP